MDTTKIAIRASTQDHLEVEDIKDGIVILKDGSSCLVISINAINFDLLSEKEQEATIWAYAALLNSLTFSIQILIRSQQKDISSYLKLLDEAIQKESKDLLKKQILKYRQFVEQTVQKNNVLDKKFYLIIPMSALELGAAKTLISTFNPKKRKLPFDKNYILERAKINLSPKKDHLLRQLSRLGIKGRQLDTQELIKLFFDVYNPQTQGQQFIDAQQYKAPLVQSTLPPQHSQTSPPPPANNDNAVLKTTEELPPQPSQNNEAQAIVFDINKDTNDESMQDKIGSLVKGSIK